MNLWLVELLEPSSGASSRVSSSFSALTVELATPVRAWGKMSRFMLCLGTLKRDVGGLFRWVSLHCQSGGKEEAGNNHRFLPQSSSDYLGTSTETGARAAVGDCISVCLPVKSDNFLHEIFSLTDTLVNVRAPIIYIP